APTMTTSWVVAVSIRYLRSSETGRARLDRHRGSTIPIAADTVPVIIGQKDEGGAHSQQGDPSFLTECRFSLADGAGRQGRQPALIGNLGGNVLPGSNHVVNITAELGFGDLRDRFSERDAAEDFVVAIEDRGRDRDN